MRLLIIVGLGFDSGHQPYGDFLTGLRVDADELDRIDEPAGEIRDIVDAEIITEGQVDENHLIVCHAREDTTLGGPTGLMTRCGRAESAPARVGRLGQRRRGGPYGHFGRDVHAAVS